MKFIIHVLEDGQYREKRRWRCFGCARRHYDRLVAGGRSATLSKILADGTYQELYKNG